MKFMGKPAYKIGDEVYHITPESRVGIITEIVYYYSIGLFKYNVSTSFGEDFMCMEHELTTSKIF